MTSPAPKQRPGSGARYTPPGQVNESTRHRPTAVKVVAALVILAMVFAPLAFLFAL